MSRRPYARPDARTREAKAKGYPARSVWKLEEIDRRVKLFSQGQRVLDLGAAPGSWSLYASERIGPRGAVLAIDRQPILQAFPETVRVVQGDALTLETAALSEHAPYDVVLSDMAPNTSGSRVADQAQSFELFSRAVDVARELGRPGSHFVGKLFMSGDFEAARAALQLTYAKCVVIRPDGTRTRSTEVFLVGLGKR
ncbi:MAG TPA: RlmE family RNA methyltransferase [Polyangiaceae bacterium]|nr:RlmE family RNA methyltransferase [Polyangiaceae bacterium]